MYNCMLNKRTIHDMSHVSGYLLRFTLIKVATFKQASPHIFKASSFERQLFVFLHGRGADGLPFCYPANAIRLATFSPQCMTRGEVVP